ncbi:ACT domain-containing protein, partial [Candidatus Aerophobetes bacterium]|nr:ACT domain-containing protein [Candidatus Aerophobetes bacterium]
MCIKQISVFAKNRPGRIKRIAEVLSSHSINIRAITIASGDDYGIIKLIVNEP